MKILCISSLWQVCKWIAMMMFAYVLIREGVSPGVFVLLLLIGLCIRLFFHCLRFIGGLIKIAVMFIIIFILITLIF